MFAYSKIALSGQYNRCLRYASSLTATTFTHTLYHSLSHSISRTQQPAARYDVLFSNSRQRNQLLTFCIIAYLRWNTTNQRNWAKCNNDQVQLSLLLTICTPNAIGKSEIIFWFELKNLRFPFRSKCLWKCDWLRPLHQFSCYWIVNVLFYHRYQAVISDCVCVYEAFRFHRLARCWYHMSPRRLSYHTQDDKTKIPEIDDKNEWLELESATTNSRWSVKLMNGNETFSFDVVWFLFTNFMSR